MSGSDNDDAPATRVVGAGRRKEWLGIAGIKGGVVNPPVWRASTHLFEDCNDIAGGRPNTQGHFFYGRRGGPTQWALCDALTALEPGAHSTELFPSGVAALAVSMLAVLRPGDEVLVTDNAYEPTVWIAFSMLSQFGITTKRFDPLDLAGFPTLIGENTKAVMLENPGSLTMEICDIPALTAIAREHGLVSIIDNTWASAIGFPALERGCDMSVMSLTKHIGGHSDLMMGSISAGEELMGKVRQMVQFLGQMVSPDDAALALRGLRSLAVRLERGTQSAVQIAQWLETREEVAQVLCPIIPDGPGYDLWQRDFTGGCGLFAFVLNTDKKGRARFIDALEHFGIGYSWGGYESLAVPFEANREYPVHDWPESADGQDTRGVRVSIGLEDPDDLIRDLERGFVAMRNA